MLYIGIFEVNRELKFTDWCGEKNNFAYNPTQT